MTDTQSDAIYASLVLYGAVGIIIVLLFEHLRHQRDIYTPKLRSRPNRSPPPPQAGFFCWIFTTLNCSDERTLQMIGIDAYVFLRFLRMLSTCASICSLLGLIVLCPLYASAPFNHLNPGIRRFTVGNVRLADERLWATLLLAWVYSLITLWLLDEEYMRFSKLRIDYMKNGDDEIPPQTYYSVIVEHVAQDCQSNEKLRQLFSLIFPEEVLFVQIPIFLDELENRIVEREAVKAKLESVIACYEGGGRKTVPKISVSENKPVLCYGEEQVDAVSYYQMELSRINNIISSLQREVEKMNLENKQSSDENNFDVSSTAFVTFRSVRAAACAAQMPILSHEYPKLKAFFAPSPGDLVWQNVPVSLAYIENSTRFTSMLLYAGIFFWGVLITTIAAITNLQYLSNYFPLVRHISPVSFSLLSGVFPVLVDAFLMLMLPVIFDYIAKHMERRKSLSHIQEMVLRW